MRAIRRKFIGVFGHGSGYKVIPHSTIEAGIRVAHRGTSSVRYEVGLFAQGEPLTAARGHFVHVYVNKASRRPQPLTEPFIQVLETLS